MAAERDDGASGAGHRSEDPPSVPTVRPRATVEAMAEQERLLAQTSRSGVRAIATDVPADDSSGIDLSNAVTKVQRAIELDAYFLPQDESPVVVRGTVSLDAPASPKSEGPCAPDDATEKAVVKAMAIAPSTQTERFDARVMSRLLADATAAYQESTAAASRERRMDGPRRAARAHNVRVALLVLFVTAGASTLLFVAGWHGDWRPAASMLEAARRLVEHAR